MYPVLIRRLEDLRPGDRLIAHNGQRYREPLQVLATLGPVPGQAGRGVQVKPAHPDAPAVVLDPSQMDGQVLEVDRPLRRAVHEHHWIEARTPPPGDLHRAWVCTLCPERLTTLAEQDTEP